MQSIWTPKRRELLVGGGAMVVLACSSEPAPNEPGALAPAMKLHDFQPQSLRHGEKYGLEEFRGSVLYLALYAGWCNTCIGCASVLNDVYKEWQAEGLNVRVAAINPTSGLHSQQALVDVCDFPLLQDDEQNNAWDALLGTKDDTYVYTAEGVLGTFIDFKAEAKSMIFTDTGQAQFRDAIVKAGG